MKGNHNQQQGFAMLILVFVIALVLTSYFVSGLSSESLERGREDKSAQALVDAKAALLGWSVAHPDYPGIMPFLIEMQMVIMMATVIVCWLAP